MSEYLTKQQTRVLDFIESHLSKNGFPPTRAEIRDHFKWSSANAAQCHLEALEKRGWLKLTPGISRGIRLAKHG